MYFVILYFLLLLKHYHLGILVIELGVGITVAAVMISIFRAYAGRTKAIDKEDW